MFIGERPVRLPPGPARPAPAELALAAARRRTLYGDGDGDEASARVADSGEAPPHQAPLAAPAESGAEAEPACSPAARAALEEELAEPLPEGWVACRAEGGEVFYHCPVTGASQWSRPGRDWTTGKLQTKGADAFLKAARGGDYRAGRQREVEAPPPHHSVYDARSRHVSLPTPPTLAADSGVSIIREDLCGRAFALHGLLTEAEASSYVSAAEATGFKGSDVQSEFKEELRNNERIIHFSDALASALWRRLAPQLAHRDIYLIQPMGFGAEGRWKPVGVNPCFRISCYSIGQHFAAHHDGMYVNDDGESSIYSIVLYLNQDFVGGELEINGAPRFAPRTGSAVLFPHDCLHAALEVTGGAKYVARTELMFRCVQATPLPSIVQPIDDPAFRRMATLYEQIGDLVTLGDAAATTEAYQEALGIQIAHQTTEARAPAVERLPATLLAALGLALAFLNPAEIVGSEAVSPAWKEAARMGVAWRKLFQERWPESRQVLEDGACALDPELKDWYGLYRRLHIAEMNSRVCTVFVTDEIEARALGRKGHLQMSHIPAVAAHRETGSGWDVSMKQRAGWIIGKGGGKGSRSGDDDGGEDYRRGTPKEPWWKNGEIQWDLLSELFAWVFQRLKMPFGEYRLVLPLCPGIWSRLSRARLARVLAGRFSVPAVCMVPAPFCVLLAHGLTTGTVVWGCSFGKSIVCCYNGIEEVFASDCFDFEKCDSSDIASRLKQVQQGLSREMAAAVLQNIILSSSFGRRNKGDDGPPRISVSQIKALLSEDSSMQSQIRSPSFNDVLDGADVLAASPEWLAAFEVAAELEPHWEWREYVDGQWCKMPLYVAGISEGAFRSERKIIAMRGNGFQIDAARFDTRVLWGSRKLTRFLRGRPSQTPDSRTSADLESDMPREQVVVERVPDAEALHVSSMSGSTLYSAKKSSIRSILVREVLEEVGANIGQPPRNLRLVAGAETLEPEASLQTLLAAEGPVELMLIVQEAPAPKEKAKSRRFGPDFGQGHSIPEEMPGEPSDVDQRLGHDALRVNMW